MGRAIVLLALGTSILFSIAPSRAVVPLGLTGSQTLALPAAAILPRCAGSAHWHFSGFQRTNGTVYGTFSFYSDIGCNTNMVFLKTDSSMRKAPNSGYFSGGPASCGADSPTAPATCPYIRKNGSVYCDPCNGTWSMDATWELRFPALFNYLPYSATDPRVVCTRKLNGKWTCTGHGLAPGTIP